LIFQNGNPSPTSAGLEGFGTAEEFEWAGPVTGQKKLPNFLPRNLFRMKSLFLTLGVAGAALCLLTAPFLPGRFDPLAGPLAMAVQLYSLLGLVASGVAAGWLGRALRLGGKAGAGPWARAYVYVSGGTGILLAVLLGFAVSRWMGLLAIGLLAFGMHRALRRLALSPAWVNQPRSAVLPALFAPFLCGMQLVLMQPLTDWSRHQAIDHSAPLIAEIGRYRDRTGHYPLSLNALNLDYAPGIAGIERYHYTYDGDTYTLYFQQPTFFPDRVGTRVMVAYCPDDRHLMMSHDSWHMLLPPEQVHTIQGWYESQPAGPAHWRVFYFD
jgi:hypothetical protein